MNISVDEPIKAFQLSRTFKWDTQLIIQVPAASGANVVIARDQAGAQNGITFLVGTGSIFDGFVVNAQTTSPPGAQPFIFVWQGDLWYAVDTPNSQFSINIATETSQRN